MQTFEREPQLVMPKGEVQHSWAGAFPFQVDPYMITSLGYQLVDDFSQTEHTIRFSGSTEVERRNSLLRLACHLIIDQIMPRYLTTCYESVLSSFQYQQDVEAISARPVQPAKAPATVGDAIVETRSPTPFVLDED